MTLGQQIDWWEGKAGPLDMIIAKCVHHVIKANASALPTYYKWQIRPVLDFCLHPPLRDATF